MLVKKSSKQTLPCLFCLQVVEASWEEYPWKRVRLGIHAGKDLLLAPNQPETASEKMFLGINGVFFWDSVQEMLDHQQLLDPGLRGMGLPERNLRDQRGSWKSPVFTLSTRT